MTKEEIIDVIANMTVLELADLVKALEEKFGVSAAMPVAAAAAPAAGAAAYGEHENRSPDAAEADDRTGLTYAEYCRKKDWISCLTCIRPACWGNGRRSCE